MKLDEVRKESRKVLDEYFLQRQLDPNARLSSLAVADEVDPHFSIGLSRQDQTDFRLEVRVRPDNGLASDYASELIQKYGSAISVRSIPPIAVPGNPQAHDTVHVQGQTYFTARRRPLTLGASIAHLDGLAGSVGLFVKFDAPELRGRLGVLSNSHVLALAGTAAKGHPVYQPGRPDAATVVHTDEVGKLENFTRIRPTGAQDLDVAVAVLKDRVEIRGNNIIPNGLEGCDHCERPITSTMELEKLPPYAEVCKVGRTTGWTKGRVTAIGVDNLRCTTRNLKRLHVLTTCSKFLGCRRTRRMHSPAREIPEVSFTIR